MKKVKIYTTAVCSYCNQAKKLLQNKGVEQFDEIRIDVDSEEREIMIKLTGRRTVPQVFIGELHVGGFDDLSALNQSGKLDDLLND